MNEISRRQGQILSEGNIKETQKEGQQRKNKERKSANNIKETQKEGKSIKNKSTKTYINNNTITGMIIPMIVMLTFIDYYVDSKNQ